MKGFERSVCESPEKFKYIYYIGKNLTTPAFPKLGGELQASYFQIYLTACVCWFVDP